MTFDGLRAFLRALFWVLAYVGVLCSAVLVFAPSPYRWAAWIAVLTIVLHDAHHRLGANGET